MNSLTSSSVTTDHWRFIVAMENVDEVCDGQHTCVEIVINEKQYTIYCVNIRIVRVHSNAEKMHALHDMSIFTPWIAQGGGVRGPSGRQIQIVNWNTHGSLSRGSVKLNDPTGAKTKHALDQVLFYKISVRVSPTNLCSLLSHSGAARKLFATSAKKAFFT